MLTFAEKMRYIEDVVEYSTMEFSNSQTRRIAKIVPRIAAFFLYINTSLSIRYGSCFKWVRPTGSFVAGLLNLIHGPFLFLAKQIPPFCKITKEFYHV